ncbi:MAG: 30S ribosomal protein S2 [Candidatus Aenigmarchaeota archaeon]|nr:30S ribosomal protein S2 [Candidatus Aenigmarchaeota archaeon]
MANMLVDKNDYLTAGVHIGMKTCMPCMKRFVYKIRDDGLAVFNLAMVNDRIKVASSFLSGFGRILVVSRKENAGQAIRKFAEAVEGRAIAGRFSPGTLTNPSYKGFYEPEVIVVVDPLIDEQAIKEAKKKRIPVVALCDTFNTVKDVDLSIPVNNNGKKSLGLIFWIMAREILKERGKVKRTADFKYSLTDFGGEEAKEAGEAKEAPSASDIIEGVVEEMEKAAKKSLKREAEAKPG